MTLDKRQMFEKLLEQINLTPKGEDFKDARIEKVIVHRESKKWEFLISTTDIPNFNEYQKLLLHAKKAFNDISDVCFLFETKKQTITDKNLVDYWEWIIKNKKTISPFMTSIIRNKKPYLEEGEVLISADNKISENVLKEQLLADIEEDYLKYGFPKLRIKVFLDESKAQEKIEKLKQSDNELTRKAMDAIKLQDSLKTETSKNDSKLPLQVGRAIQNVEVIQMKDITEEERSVVVEGYVFDCEIRNLKSERKLLTLKITDYTSSFVVKKFSKQNGEDDEVFEMFKKGLWVKVRGNVQEDAFLKELVINAYDINEAKHEKRQDTSEEKRVELHLHTNMSTMDATNSILEYVKQASDWGHKAIAVTDHGTLQAFPDAHNAGKKYNVKILYGVEANIVDDSLKIAYNDDAHVNLKDATYVVFDTETTGLSANYDKVIELAAVKMKNGEVIERFEQFIDPGHPLSETTIKLTSITDDMVRGSKSELEVFKMFKDFCKGCIIVGHNATFDVDFMNVGYKRHQISKIEEPWIDTLPLARALYPEMKRFTLDTLSRKLKVDLKHHHRAIYDAEATGYIYYAMLRYAQEKYTINFFDELNQTIKDSKSYQKAHPFHAIILAKTQKGLKNLFKLISNSMTEYFYRVPRVPRFLLDKYREGLLVGSACANGEVFTTMMQKGYEFAEKKAKYYDYLEIQPQAMYQPEIERELIKDNNQLEEIIKNIIKLGKNLNLPVVATGDVHFMNKEDAIYRKILIHSQGGANPLNRLQKLPDAHFRTTDEMLKDFEFLGENVAREVVISNPNKIVNMCEEVSPVKDKLYTPKMEGSNDNIRSLAMKKAHELYGEKLPEIVEKRLTRELNAVIDNGFSVIYLISQKLVFKSNKDGYLVGSRGSVGSSFAATMTGITEVNPLPPHYRCPKCKYSEFYTKGEYGSGFDLPDKKCPHCNTLMIKDGHDIPFETFLGFKGDKVPDIDLNFSGDYQPIAHNYTKVLFGENNVYRAGTIGTVADKTAYGFVKAFERDTEQEFRGAEVDRLAKGATGVKRTTGQHPAGILVVPDYMDIYDFTPIQYPADDLSATWKTTHFDFHSIHDNILKLDILGHDDPTMIRMLQDLSGIDPKTIPTDDPGVMALFAGTEQFKVTPEQIQSKTGTLGIPEFGTRFVRGMLEETKPKTFAELLKISGLSHGTDVWLGNAEELIKKNIVTMPEVIGCRDDIMMDLIHMGVDSGTAFKIMESVRKGKGIPDDWQKEMREANVPEWYIGACLKIKYMFPKAHAAAYVLMALRIAYFKTYFPLTYYAAYFSVRADDFDLVAMSHGKEATKSKMKEINDKGNDASAKEKNLLTVLELANEMLERGFDFKMVDLNKSQASNWLIEGKSLIAPFSAIPGLGLNVAKQIIAAREEQEFLSKEDLSKRGKVSSTLIEFMTVNHVLDDLPDENQLSLFDNIF